MTYLEAVIPGRGEVKISANPGDWPQKDGETGLVPHWAIVPDAQQPRSYIDPALLREFAKSFAINGQREVATVTLLQQGQAVLDETTGKKALYELVSGERRWRACGPEGANIAFFEIRVRIYGDKEEQFEDAFLLNESRDDLPHLDRARAYKRLLLGRCNGSKQRLVDLVGQKKGRVEMFLSLNDLSATVQEHLHPSLPQKEQMLLGTAVRLSKVSDHGEQERLARLIMRGRGGISAPEQRRWIDEQLLGKEPSATSKEKKSKRSHLRERLVTFPDSVRPRILAIVEIPDDDFHAICNSMDLGALEKLKLHYESLYGGLGTAVGRFAVEMQKTRIHAGVKKHIAGIVERFRNELFSLSNGDETTLLQLTRGYENMQRDVEAVLDRFELEIKRKIATESADLPAGWIPVDYYERGEKRISGQALSPARYRELGSKGWLAYQVDGLPKPIDLPDWKSAGGY